METKKLFVAGLILLSGILAACGQQETKEEVLTIESSSIMQAVETSKTKAKEEISQSSEPVESTEEAEDSEEKKSKQGHMELLQTYGEAYVNFKSINHRNEKLKDLMTEECIQMNGIDIVTGNGLGSEGKVTSIYQNDQDEYAVLLDCIQNGSPIRILLLAKVEDGKIAEMTYNTLKKEY